MQVSVTDKNREGLVLDKHSDPLKLQFDIPRNIVDVMYRQVLVWAGTPFTPVLPFVSLLASFVLFYIKKFEVLPSGVRTALTPNRSPAGIQVQLEAQEGDAGCDAKPLLPGVYGACVSCTTADQRRC